MDVMSLRGRTALRLPWILLVTLGCTHRDDPDALDRVRTAGLRAGFAIEPPYAFVDGGTGEPSGEAPEILRWAAAELDIPEIEWYPLPFHDLTDALTVGRIDVIASGMFVSEKRSEQVRFSMPSACVQPLLVGRRATARMEKADADNAAADADDSCDDCRVAVIQGSVEHAALEKYGSTDHSVVVVPDLSTAAAAVLDSVADVLAISAPTARNLVKRDSALMLDARMLPQEVLEHSGGCPAFAFRHEDEVLAVAFDSVLSDFIGSASHLEIVAPFGFTEAEAGCAVARAGSTDSAASVCAASQ
ncbi:MAG TPA: transporter substrate-binding domain-containing protein [Longimicrobiales bacterium]|nr:transporter substrate-binding domain-containing protein [Longimicrobiales bacterium]